MQRVYDYQVLRLRRELRREREERKFFERLAFIAFCVAGVMTGALLALTAAIEMI